MKRASLILDQNLVANLQPSNSAMHTLIKSEQVNTQKQEKKLDKRISKAILDTEEQSDGP